jgi:hypothetical protein
VTTIRRAAIALLGAAALAGCASGKSATDPAERQLPLRPFDISVDRVDPCNLLTREQLDQLDVSGGRFKPEDRRGPAACAWDRSSRDDGFQSYLVGIDPSVQVDLARVSFAVVTVVAEFPAILTHNELSTFETQCIVVLNVAPNQTVQVNYDYNGPRLPLTREETCGKAQHAAEMVMQNLINVRGDK